VEEWFNDTNPMRFGGLRQAGEQRRAPSSFSINCKIAGENHPFNGHVQATGAWINESPVRSGNRYCSRAAKGLAISCASERQKASSPDGSTVLLSAAESEIAGVVAARYAAKKSARVHV